MQNVHIPIVRVDPENRCAVMLVYGTKLVVLPFRKDTLTDEQEAGVGEGYAHTFSLSFTKFCTVKYFSSLHWWSAWGGWYYLILT